MTEFSGLEYILIAISNAFGMDKDLWEDRLDWATKKLRSRNRAGMYLLCEHADEPLLMRNAINAYYDAIEGKPTGFLMSLDATASGPQLLACMMDCRVTARQVNLINTGERNDCYTNMAKIMSKAIGYKLWRGDIKEALMTSFYGSRAEPKNVFGADTPELEEFYKTRDSLFPGAVEAMQDIESCWDCTALVHKWRLPDGHTAYVPVMETVDKRINLPDLGNASFTYRCDINMPSDYSIPLIANVTHSVDGYVVREMTRRAAVQGFELLHIHDSFWASPNYMNQVRQNYNDILAEIAESDLLQSILRDITGDYGIILTKRNGNIAADIRDAEYSLS